MVKKVVLKSFLLICAQLLNFSESLNHEILLKNPFKTVNMELVQAIHSIIENVYLKRFTTVNIISAMENQNDQYFQSFRNSLIRQHNGFGIYRLDNHTHIMNIKSRLKIYNIILLDSFKTFEILYERIKPDKFNFRGMYLFVLLNGLFEQSEQIFSAMWEKFIINVNLIYDDDGVVTMATYQPFERKACGNTNFVVLDTFQNGKFNLDYHQIFPNKLANLNRCKVRMVTFHRCPAMCVTTNAKGKLVADGFDMGIIKLIAENLNFQLDTEILEGDEQWGTVYPNGTGTGAIDKILKREADIIIGNYLLRSSRVAIMDNSVVYFSFPVVFAIPLGPKLNPFEKLLRPYEIYVWLALMTTLTIGVLVIVVVNWRFKRVKAFVFGRGNKSPMVNFLVVVFGGSQKYLPKRNFSRFLLTMFLLFCLVKRNVYQGSLYIFLQSDGRHKEVQSIDEMVEKDFDFYMYESYSDIVTSQPKVYNRRKVIISEKGLIFNEPLEESVKAAFMTSLTDVIYRNQMTYKKFVLKVCKEQLLTVSIVMYFPKNFYMREAFDKKLGALSTSGLLKYWTQKYADPRFLKVQSQQTGGPQQLQMQHLFGIINIWLIGCAIGAICLVLEIFGSLVKRTFKTK